MGRVNEINFTAVITRWAFPTGDYEAAVDYVKLSSESGKARYWIVKGEKFPLGSVFFKRENLLKVLSVEEYASHISQVKERWYADVKDYEFTIPESKLLNWLG